jgi:hypothetical protein
LAKQRRGEGRGELAKKKTAAVYQNMERTRCQKKIAAACQTRVLEVLEVTSSSSSNKHE